MPSQEQLEKVFGIENFEDALKRGATPDTQETKPTPKVEENTETGPDAGPQEAEDNNTAESQEQTEEEIENEALSNSEDEQEDNKETNKENKNKSSHRDTKAEARIAKLAREKERLKGQLEALRSQQNNNRQQEQQTFIDPDAPNPNLYPQGEQDLDYRLDLRLYQREQQEKIKNFHKTQQEIITKYPNTPELLELDKERVEAGYQTINPTVVKLIMESDVSGELWHYLLENSDEALEIAKMDPVKTAKAIGRIEAKLENTTDNTTTKKTNLPPPLKPVKSTKTNNTAGVKNFGFIGY